jgi:hypothetical protein
VVLLSKTAEALTEINITTPKPAYANYWRDREAAGGRAPAAALARG